jgi:cytochrome P450
VDDLLDTMTAGGPPADISESLCWLLPITVICELLGVPLADRDRFRNWTNHFLVLTGDPADTVEARDRLKDYFAGLIAHCRVEPTNDLLGELVQVRDNDDRLSERELLNLGIGLLFAGHETTANQIGNFLYTLLTNRGYWDELVADAGLVPAAVEELSRIIPLGASAGFTRIATEDLELGGQRIKAGEAVVVETASANRDTEVFDHPDDIDFHRAENPHLAFGHGLHHCLGAQLARMEMQTAITTLVRRLPSLRLAVAAEDVPWRTDRLIRGPIRLPVTW